MICLPLFRRTDKQDYILSSEQLNPVPAPLGLDLVVKKENVKGRGTRRKHSIVLEERTKLLKAAAHEQRPSGDIVPKKETTLDACCLRAPSKSIAKKSCQCLEDVDCDHMNFQVCTHAHVNMHSIEGRAPGKVISCEDGFASCPPAENKSKAE